MDHPIQVNMKRNYSVQTLTRCRNQRFKIFKMEPPKFPHSEDVPLVMITSGIFTPVCFEDEQEETIWNANKDVIVESADEQSLRACVFHNEKCVGFYDIAGAKIRWMARDLEVKGRFFAKVVVKDKKRSIEVAVTFYRI